MVINTTKSIRDETTQTQMPVINPTPDAGPDGDEEDPDRVGNTDLGCNIDPAEVAMLGNVELFSLQLSFPDPKSDRHEIAIRGRIKSTGQPFGEHICGVGKVTAAGIVAHLVKVGAPR